MTAILEIAGLILKLISEWPQRRVESARKKYANWRAGSELKKEKRKSRTDLVDSAVDLVRNSKD